MRSLLNNTRKPDVSFHADGHIDITARVSGMLEIEPGDIIDIMYDDGEYLLYIRTKAANVVGRHEAVCRSTCPTKRKYRSLRCHSKRLCNAMLKVTGRLKAVRLAVGDAVELPIGCNGVPLITRLKIDD